MKQWLNNRRGVILLVLVFLALNAIFFLISPEQLVEYVAEFNVYIAIFIIASVSGISSLTGGILYVAIAAFAAGGSSPWLLGVAGGLGIAIGDSIIFYLFRYTARALPQKWVKRVDMAKRKVEHLPRPVQYFLIYTYLSLAPFPTDFLIFLLAVLRFKIRQVLPLLIVGGITAATLTAFLGETLTLFYK